MRAFRKASENAHVFAAKTRVFMFLFPSRTTGAVPFFVRPEIVCNRSFATQVFLISDARRHGNENDLLSAFLNQDGKLMPKDKRCIYLEYTEESIAERKERDKGSIDVMEYMWQVTAAAFCPKDRKRKHFPQSARSNKIGPIALPQLSSLWSLTFGQKKQLYGPLGRIAAGGPADKDEHEEPEDEKKLSLAKHRTNVTVEPVAFMDMSVQFYEDMYDAYRAKAVINLTSAGVNAAMAAIQMKIPYVGITWTVAHSDFMQAELIQQVFAGFQDEGSPLYEADLVALVCKDTTKKKKDKQQKTEKEGAEEPPKKKARQAAPKKGSAASKPDPKSKQATKADKKPLSKEAMLKALQKAGDMDSDEGAEEDEEEEEADSED